MVTAITSANQFNQAINQDKLVIVNFFATWSGPSNVFSSTFEKFEREYTNAFDVEFLKLDADELNSIVDEQGIRGFPTVIFYKNGSVVDKEIGGNPRAVQEKINTLAEEYN
ncbi:Thioredoxin [Wickerhamomyces ciferrii]|uniref:Thioredoxin n=1 Tax=Wickerhamomyces ciferrii (strain ATCC 14091 / BCRC 22168 / CBS 111 / JCM 3599 / NBRC 0793 / NRRL Y-1031 F-60-10) TaxID=1206466 RepID=K0KSA4_WICCF|nr:Thioredoxin [Wickerhamomyces ciferrii]CCH44218.1 Thioredoxin [Wickerhamomyces ciferrii]